MRTARVVYLAFGLASLTVLSVATGLTPSAARLGTHTQLGLPACGFLSRTGWPCPSCGLTTSFALAIRGRFADAAFVQPFGFLLFCALLAAIPFFLYRAARPVVLTRVFDVDRTFTICKGVLILYLTVWAVQLLRL
ncbi:MAG: DUF2752 domain-containing protein [Acidobacteria bacterium]|nr:DUF2752 domain-containing protein [Acidobacteriota bacterium]